MAENGNSSRAVLWAAVGVILTLLLQTGALAYWGGHIAAVQDAHSAELADHENRVRVLEWERRQDSATPPTIPAPPRSRRRTAAAL